MIILAVASFSLWRTSCALCSANFFGRPKETVADTLAVGAVADFFDGDDALKHDRRVGGQ